MQCGCQYYKLFPNLPLNLLALNSPDSPGDEEYHITLAASDSFPLELGYFDRAPGLSYLVREQLEVRSRRSKTIITSCPTQGIVWEEETFSYNIHIKIMLCGCGLVCFEKFCLISLISPSKHRPCCMSATMEDELVLQGKSGILLQLSHTLNTTIISIKCHVLLSSRVQLKFSTNLNMRCISRVT